VPDLVLWCAFNRGCAAQLLLLAFDLAPQGDDALDVTHEHLAVVALCANQQLTEIVYVVFP